MTIQFKDSEINAIKTYFEQVESGERLTGPDAAQPVPPQENARLLLLRKLLAYGVWFVDQGPDEIPYPTLQARSQKPSAMWTTVHAHLSDFKRLLARYMANG